jgi:copper chaperone CopZ
MAIVRETIHVTGVRCERCVMRLATTLEGHEGLEFANATLMGELHVGYDDERTSRVALVAALARGGFRELQAV